MAATTAVELRPARADPATDGSGEPGGRLLSVAEIQRAYRVLAGRRPEQGVVEALARMGTATDDGRSGPDVQAPDTPARAVRDTSDTRCDPSPDAPDTDRPPANGVPDPDALRPDWIVVAAAHSGAGASSIALALVDALSAAGQPSRLIETAPASRSGLVAAASAEMGLDPTGAWRRGSRQLAALLRRANDEPPDGWPKPVPAEEPATTVVDVGLPAPANLSRLGTDKPAVVVVCRVSVPGVRMAERLIARLDGVPVVLAAIGPRRWPGEVTASIGPHLGELRRAERVVPVPADRRLQVIGPANTPLPKPVTVAAHRLLGLIDAARELDAETSPRRPARLVPRKRGIVSWSLR